MFETDLWQAKMPHMLTVYSLVFGREARRQLVLGILERTLRADYKPVSDNGLYTYSGRRGARKLVSVAMGERAFDPARRR